MSKWHGGKGSSPRPVDKAKFDSNWDKIFGKKDNGQVRKAGPELVHGEAITEQGPTVRSCGSGYELQQKLDEELCNE